MERGRDCASGGSGDKDHAKKVHECREEEKKCHSFEYSPTQIKCNLNEISEPYERAFSDFMFCTKLVLWYLKAQGSLNENGCSNKDLVRGETKETVSSCKEFCKDTKFLQYHGSKYCGCFKSCDFQRPASDYVFKADVYEQQTVECNSNKEKCD